MSVLHGLWFWWVKKSGLVDPDETDITVLMGAMDRLHTVPAEKKKALDEELRAKLLHGFVRPSGETTTKSEQAQPDEKIASKRDAVYLGKTKAAAPGPDESVDDTLQARMNRKRVVLDAVLKNAAIEVVIWRRFHGNPAVDVKVDLGCQVSDRVEKLELSLEDRSGPLELQETHWEKLAETSGRLIATILYHAELQYPQMFPGFDRQTLERDWGLYTACAWPDKDRFAPWKR